MFTLATYNTFLIVMAVVAVVVFIALSFVDAGYGYLFNPKFGFPIPNRIAWVIMECPVFIVMTILWWLSDVRFEIAPLVLFLIFQTHYFQRSFIFPLLIRGNSKMPFGIMLMGAVFNTLNAFMQGGWIFYLAPEQNYYDGWMCKQTILSAICESQAIQSITFQRVVCSAMYHQQTTLASLPSGSASLLQVGLGQVLSSHYGHLQTLALVRHHYTRDMKVSLARSLHHLVASE